MDTASTVGLALVCAALGATAGTLMMAALNACSYDKGRRQGQHEGYEAARSNPETGAGWHDRKRLMDQNLHQGEELQATQAKLRQAQQANRELSRQLARRGVEVQP